MKLPNLAQRKWNYTALAFLFPFVGMLTVMLFSQYCPFGKYSMLYSDMYHQYYPFFVAYRSALRSGESLLYSWSIGMGVDYLGLISYYLGSPFNLLSVLVPEKLLLSYFSLLVPMKLGLAGCFFAVFLKKLFRRDDFSITVFGAFYGLCAWALGFQWNVMWLDTFALLPIVVLGTVYLLRDKKFVLYTVSLFLAVIINYYIGLFVCYFVALVFFCYEICRFRGWKRFFADLLRIALFSALAIGMTAILELPTLAALGTTQSSVNQFPTAFRLNIVSQHNWKGLLDAMRQVAGNMGGALEPNFKEGLPNLYCGVGTIVLAVLYLLSGEVKLRDKLCAFGLLLFFNLSFIIRQLDYIWHGFHFPNMIPYRFSFLYSFVMLYMAYRAWTLRRSFRVPQIAAAALFTAALLCCSDSLLSTEGLLIGDFYLDIPVYLLYNLLFLLFYTGAMLYGAIAPRLAEDAEPEERRESRILLCHRRILVRCIVLGTVCVELIATLVSFGLYFPGTLVSNYPKGTEEAASMIRYLHEREEGKPFYRAETTHSQTLNDGALNGYNGISAFTSSANVKVTEFMQSWGYGAKNTYNRYCFEESSPVANLFLNLKYMIERDGRDRSGSCFREVHHYGKVYLLENNYYLPLGFLTEKDLADLDFSGLGDSFAMQNTVFSAATGVERSVWQEVPGSSYTIEGSGTSLSGIGNGYCKYDDTGTGASVTFSFTADRDGFVCVRVDFPKRNDVVLSVNGVEIYRESISLPQMMAVGDVKLGDVISIRAECKSGESGTLSVASAVLVEDVFREGYEKLSASTLELTTFRNTFLEGTIRCDRDGLLYTSVPQNGNWSVSVDGEKTDILLVGDCMVAVELSEGTHQVTLSYHNRAFSLGWKISLACAVLFGLLVWKYEQPDWKRKYPE